MRKTGMVGLLEMTVMLLIFALAAALCLQMFAWADSTTQDSMRRDEALINLQSTAEILKNSGGNYEEAAQIYGGTWDGCRWVITCDGYHIAVVPESTGIIGLGRARLDAVAADQVVVSLTVCWQEVSHGT